MGRIDRYILRQFVLTFLFSLLAFVVIYIAVNVMENLGDFFDNHVPGTVILTYYIFYVPDMVQLIVPIGMLLAALFTIGRLDTTHELTAIRAAGRSMPRVAAPLLAFGLIISLVMVYFDGWVVPYTNKQKFAIERKYLGKNLMGGQHLVFKRLSPTLNLLIDYFDPTTGQASMVTLERFDTTAKIPSVTIDRKSVSETVLQVDTVSGIRITERIDAISMRYDSTSGHWIMQNGIARNFNTPPHVGVTKFTERELSFLPITPEELNLSQQKPAELTLEEMRDRIEQERLGGRDVAGLMIDYYGRFAFPFSAFIVIFFGIPFTSGQRKGGAAVQIAITALISAVYLILTEVSKTFTYGADFPPALTAWMANIVFFLVGIFNLYRIERR